MEHAMPMACGITATIEVREAPLRSAPTCLATCFKALSPCGHRIMFVSWTGVNRGGCDDRAMMVCDRETLLPCLRLVPRLSDSIAPVVATVLVPSPWSTLVSRCFAAARWATGRCMPATATHQQPVS